MSNTLQEATRFINADWKELDTAFVIQRRVLAECNLYSTDTVEHRTLNAMFNQLELIIKEIARLTADVNPATRYANTVILPQVAWLPCLLYNDETGEMASKPMPDIPEFASKAERCHYLKQLADAALEEKHKEPVVVEEKKVQVEEEGSDVNPSDQSAREQEVQSPAQAALSAIRSRRKKKD